MRRELKNASIFRLEILKYWQLFKLKLLKNRSHPDKSLSDAFQGGSMVFLNMFLAIMVSFASDAMASSYTMAKINVGYGKLDIQSGSGYVYANADDQTGKLKGISIRLNVGILGYNQNISEYQDIKSLVEGKSLSFNMEGSHRAVLIIRPKPGFNAYGGNIDISVLKSNGYQTTSLSISRGMLTQHYKFWKGSSEVYRFNINTRGYSIAELYVGWYEIVTSE
jgi:hypothetical protein